MPSLVSVVTPTWQRHPSLFRCLRSVQQQTYWPWEHLVVSDGPDPALADRLLGWGYSVTLAELPGHDPAIRWGLRARLRGLELAQGEFVAYLDDDDTWRPDHLERVVDAMLATGADVGWGSARVHFPDGSHATLGGEPSWGRVQTSMVVHRRLLLGISTWRDEELPEWCLVERWLDAGATSTWVDEVTVDYRRSRMPERAIPVTAPRPAAQGGRPAGSQPPGAP